MANIEGRKMRKGLQLVWERDGVAVSEQIRRSIRTWLESRGVVAPPKSKRGKAQGKRNAVNAVNYRSCVAVRAGWSISQYWNQLRTRSSRSTSSHGSPVRDRL